MNNMNNNFDTKKKEGSLPLFLFENYLKFVS